MVELGYIIISLLILILLIYVGYSFFSFFAEEKEHESTMNNFRVLTSTIKYMDNEMNNEDKDYLQKDLSYYISEDYIIVGFNHDDKDTEFKTQDFETFNKARPDYCKESSCLCIYPKIGEFNFDKSEDFNPPVECEEFNNKKVVFLADYDLEDENFVGVESPWEFPAYPDTQYEFFIFQQEDSKVLTLDVETMKQEDVLFVFLRFK